MAQIIKHRRGSISDVKGTTTRNGELLIASGSISDLSGPFVFIGSPVSSDEGVAGAFKPTSKVYSGNSAPTIASATYGSILDGTPFYASSNESLYILNNDGVGNDRLDLTGNIEGNVIANVTITSLTGSNANVTNVTGGTVTVTGNETIGGTLGVTGNTLIGGTLGVTRPVTMSDTLSVTGDTVLGATLSVTGDTTMASDLEVVGDITGSNLRLSGNAEIAGNINLGGNITVGDATTDFVKFGADVSSSIIPDVHNAFDLGSSSQNWRNLHISGTAYVDSLEARNINLDSIRVINNLTVEGDTQLGNEAGDVVQVVAGDIEFQNIPAGDTTIFIGLDGSNKLVQDEIDSRVLGNTLIDNNGTLLTANRVVLAADGDSLKDDGDLTFDGTTNVLSVGSSRIGDNVTVASKLTTTGVSELKDAVGINSTLSVTGSAQFKSSIDVDSTATLASAVVEDLTTTRIVFVGDGGQLRDHENLTFDETTLRIEGGVIATGDINGGSLTISGNSNITGATNIGGELTVTGNTNLQGNLYVSGNLEILGSATEVNIQSQTVEIDDNIIRLNAYSPFERYAGFEVMDSGSSGVSASLVWDSQNDYWMFVSSSSQSSKLIGTTAGSYGTESSLTTNVIPKGTGANTIGDSLLEEDGARLVYNTNAFIVTTEGNTTIRGSVELQEVGGPDNASNTSAILFRNSDNLLGYVSTTETTDVLDGILGYKASDGALVFSTVIDGGTY